MPRVDVRPNQHHLIAQRRILSWDLGNDVVAVAVFLEIARPQLDAERHRASLGGQTREDVVLLARDDERGHRVRGSGAIAGHAHSAIAIGARPQSHCRARLLEQHHQLSGRNRATGLRERGVARGDRALIETGLRPVASDELGLRKVGQHDGATKLPGHGLDLRGSLIADVDCPPVQYARRGRGPCFTIGDEGHVARFGHLRRHAFKLPAATELERLEARIAKAPFLETIYRPPRRLDVGR